MIHLGWIEFFKWHWFVDSNKLKIDIHQAFTCNEHSSRKFMLLFQKLFVNSVWANSVPYKTILFQKILEPVMRSRKNATIFPFIFDYYFLGNKHKEGRVLYTKLTFKQLFLKITLTFLMVAICDCQNGLPLLLFS